MEPEVRKVLDSARGRIVHNLEIARVRMLSEDPIYTDRVFKQILGMIDDAGGELEHDVARLATIGMDSMIVAAHEETVDPPDPPDPHLGVMRGLLVQAREAIALIANPTKLQLARHDQITAYLNANPGPSYRADPDDGEGPADG